MDAYSFKKRFGPPILAGTKAQTIRADRKRHARPGEELQLYTGMRTKHCKLLGRPTCIDVVPVQLCFSKRGASELFEVGGLPISPREMVGFAHDDGFESIQDMADFWWREHGSGSDALTFEGVLIRWTPLVPADALDIAAKAA